MAKNSFEAIVTELADDGCPRGRRGFYGITEDTAKWIRVKAAELNVPQGIILDALVSQAASRDARRAA